MALWCNSTPQFMPGDKVVSLVYHHSPEVQPGTTGDIASCQVTPFSFQTENCIGGSLDLNWNL